MEYYLLERESAVPKKQNFRLVPVIVYC
jgi:hypothetical protein